MHTAAMIAGIVCIFSVLLDAFQTIILPRRATGRVRLTRIFYIITWPPWVFFANRIQHPRKRETAFSFYGPFSLILLLGVWAALLLFGFGLLYYSLGTPFYDIRQRAGLWSDLYVSGTEMWLSSSSADQRSHSVSKTERASSASECACRRKSSEAVGGDPARASSSEMLTSRRENAL